jgi:hypothetical protein
MATFAPARRLLSQNQSLEDLERGKFRLVALDPYHPGRRQLTQGSRSCVITDTCATEARGGTARGAGYLRTWARVANGFGLATLLRGRETRSRAWPPRTTGSLNKAGRKMRLDRFWSWLGYAVLLLSLSGEAAAATLCRSAPTDRKYWSWRQIDGRRCWYPGIRRLDKDQLTWQVSPAPGSTAPAAAPVAPTPAQPIIEPLDLCCWPPPDNLSRCCWPPAENGALK